MRRIYRPDCSPDWPYEKNLEILVIFLLEVSADLDIYQLALISNPCGLSGKHYGTNNRVSEAEVEVIQEIRGLGPIRPNPVCNGGL